MKEASASVRISVGEYMNVQFIRLEDDVCEPLNQMALAQRRTVSELVSQILREFLKEKGGHPANGAEPTQARREMG